MLLPYSYGGDRSRSRRTSWTRRIPPISPQPQQPAERPTSPPKSGRAGFVHQQTYSSVAPGTPTSVTSPSPPLQSSKHNGYKSSIEAEPSNSHDFNNTTQYNHSPSSPKNHSHSRNNCHTTSLLIRESSTSTSTSGHITASILESRPLSRNKGRKPR